MKLYTPLNHIPVWMEASSAVLGLCETKSKIDAKVCNLEKIFLNINFKELFIYVNSF